MAPYVAGVGWQTLLNNPHLAQWFCTLVLFGSWAAHRRNIPRNEPAFWNSQATQVMVRAIGIGAAVSLVDSAAETLLAATPLHDTARTAVAHANYSTAALIVPPVAVTFSLCLPTLHTREGRWRSFLAGMLEARRVWPVMLAAVAGGTLILAFAPPEFGGVRVDATAWGWAYRLSMLFPAGVYAVVICAALAHAYLVGRRPQPAKHLVVFRRRRSLPRPASQPAPRMHPRPRAAPAQDPLARRWKYLSLSLAGCSLLELTPFALPLIAEFTDPGSLLARRTGALSRLGEVPAFLLIGAGAYLAFSRKRSKSPSEKRWDRYDYYKQLVESLDQLLAQCPRLCAEGGIDLPSIEARMEYTLAEFNPRARATTSPRVLLRLLALSHLASRGPLAPDRLRGYLFALAALNAEFRGYPEGTEPRNQAHGDDIAPVAEDARLLLSPYPECHLAPGARPDWVHVVTAIGCEARLLPTHLGAHITPRVRRALNQPAPARPF